MRTIRSVALADHLWELYARMAEEMGSDREALVNQAMHAFARSSGFLSRGEATPTSTPDPSGAGATEPREPRAVADEVLETAARLEREARAGELPPPIPAGPAPAALRRLLLLREDGVEAAVEEARFLIGRGRHCHLVIDSAKVSREHAAIVRDGEGWAIEDLDSANGTWYRGARVDRRRIEDGDEYLVCAERLRCQLR